MMGFNYIVNIQYHLLFKIEFSREKIRRASFLAWIRQERSASDHRQQKLNIEIFCRMILNPVATINMLRRILHDAYEKLLQEGFTDIIFPLKINDGPWVLLSIFNMPQLSSEIKQVRRLTDSGIFHFPLRADIESCGSWKRNELIIRKPVGYN